MNLVKKVRQKFELTQPQLGELLGGKDKHVISKWENGSKPIPYTVKILLEYMSEYGLKLAKKLHAERVLRVGKEDSGESESADD